MILEPIMAEMQYERGCQRHLWYGDSSHRATVRLWWGQYTGGQGAIYTSISGNPYDYLLAVCQNASRVVKYVVIIGQRYVSNPLLDMRVHDINVLADPNRRIPAAPEPEGAEGTYSGYSNQDIRRILSADSYARAQEALNSGATAPEPYWTGPWPVLHIPVEIFVERCHAFFEIVIDLLMNTDLAALAMDIPYEEGIPQNQIETTMNGLILELLGAWGGLIGILGMELRIGMALIDTISLIPHPGTIAAVTGLYLAWLALFAVWVWAVLALVDQGVMSPGAAGAGFLVMASSFLGFMIGSLKSEWKAFKAFQEKFETQKHRFWKNINKWYAIYTIIVIIVKVSAFLTCLILGLYLMGVHASLYGW